MRQRLLSQGLIVSALLSLSLGRAQEWVPPIVKEPHLFVKAQVLSVHPPETKEIASGYLEAAPGRPGKWILPLDVPVTTSQRAVSLELTVEGGAAEDGSITMSIATDVIVERGGQRASNRRQRSAEVVEGGSVLHAAYENSVAESSITIILTPEARIVPAVVKPTASAPILFKLTLSQRIEGALYPVEDNILRTMEGGPVSYSFRQAAEPGPPTGTPSTGGTTEPRPRADEGETSEKGSAPAAAPSGADPPPPAVSPRSAKALRKGKSARSGKTAPAAEPALPNTSSPQAGPEPQAEPAPPPETPYDALELTLLPRRSSEDLLMVEVTIKGTLSEQGGAKREVLLHRTQAVTRNGSFDVAPEATADGVPPYRFHVQVVF